MDYFIIYYAGNSPIIKKTTEEKLSSELFNMKAKEFVVVDAGKPFVIKPRCVALIRGDNVVPVRTIEYKKA